MPRAAEEEEDEGDTGEEGATGEGGANTFGPCEGALTSVVPCLLLPVHVAMVALAPGHKVNGVGATTSARSHKLVKMPRKSSTLSPHVRQREMFASNRLAGNFSKRGLIIGQCCAEGPPAIWEDGPPPQHTFHTSRTWGSLKVKTLAKVIGKVWPSFEAGSQTQCSSEWSSVF